MLRRTVAAERSVSLTKKGNAVSARLEFTTIGTISLALLSTVGWISVCVLPYEISMLAVMPGKSLVSASWIASAELLALATAVAVTGRMVKRENVRALVWSALCACLLASALGAVAQSTGAMLVSRLLFGASAGVIGAVTNSLAGRHPRPERMFAYVLFALSIVTSVVMYAIPALEPRFGILSLFGSEAVLIGLAACAAVFMPMMPAEAPGSKASSAPVPVKAALVLAGLAIFYVSQALVWGYSEQAGASVGVRGTVLGTVFLTSALGQLPGSLLAAVLGEKFRYKAPILAGFAILFLVFLGVYCTRSAFVFSASILAFNATTVFVVPYVQGILANLDPDGRSSGLSIGAINFGSAVGPALGLTSAFMPGLASIGFMSTGLLAISLGFIFSGIRAIDAGGTGVAGRVRRSIVS